MRTLNRPELPQAGISPSDIIPDGWTVAPLKRFFRVAGGATPTSDPENWDGDIPWVTPGDLSGLDNFFIGKGKRSITERGYKSCGTELVPVGSVILSTRAPIGSLAIAQERLCTNQGCKALVPTTTVDARFFAYALSVATPQLNALGQGSTFRELSGESLGSFRLPVPSPQEQCRIAAFLDHETARIDELVREQEALLTQLEERKSSFILNAVSGQLDRYGTAREWDEGRDSGNKAQRRQLPYGWRHTKLKWAGRLIGGSGFPHEFQGHESGDLAFYKVGDIARSSDGVNMPSAQHHVSRSVASQLRARELPVGSVLWAKIGAALLLNRRRITREPCCVDNNMTGFMPDIRKLTSEWAYYSMLVVDFGEYVNPGAVPSLSEGDQAEIEIPLPPLADQERIVSRLELEVSQIEALRRETRKGIELLLERRSALISAAVTGQLDLSGWQPPEPEAVAEVA